MLYVVRRTCTLCTQLPYPNSSRSKLGRFLNDYISWTATGYGVGRIDPPRLRRQARLLSCCGRARPFFFGSMLTLERRPRGHMPDKWSLGRFDCSVVCSLHSCFTICVLEQRIDHRKLARLHLHKRPHRVTRRCRRPPTSTRACAWQSPSCA